MTQSNDHSKSTSLSVIIGSLGIVFGDIGTSPLYALRECFGGDHAIPVTPENIFGLLSLITWALLIIISLKYVIYVMYADNNGEGGILALTALVAPASTAFKSKSRYLVLLIGLFGSALLYGDGIITPAISVLSAVEGLVISTPIFSPLIIPITITILILLFTFQSRGTGNIGAIFGPMILVWFILLAVLGISGIIEHPSILMAASPHYAISFFIHNRMHALLSLGAVFLVVTGGEALYADMGHFGRQPIQRAWYFIVLPGLLLNYFGQGAHVLLHPEDAINPFYLLAPKWAIVPLVIMATLACVIASQALITGTFSITRQAVNLGYLPRIAIRHTSAEEIGQIYVPLINWFLFVCTILLVITFRSSSKLANAYGLAVTVTMIITTFLSFFVSRDRWKWKLPIALTVTGLLLVIEFTFLSANILKFLNGGWLPVAIGLVILYIMTSWRKGRNWVASVTKEKSISIEKLLETIEQTPPTRVPGVAVFLGGSPTTVPLCLLQNLKHNQVLHEKTMILVIQFEDIPHVPINESCALVKYKKGIMQLTVRYGFMDSPNIPAVLMYFKESEVQCLLSEVTYFLGRETIVRSARHIGLVRATVFALLSHNSHRAVSFFRVPPHQVIEMGLQTEV